mmetsp:Transcript_83383/g.170061  ORF Transcript_83383/g.170061 Transcript_83383/m.170061 type:complete len:237 (+) Transcript_83383:964-1674(+)
MQPFASVQGVAVQELRGWNLPSRRRLRPWWGLHFSLRISVALHSILLLLLLQCCMVETFEDAAVATCLSLLLTPGLRKGADLWLECQLRVVIGLHLLQSLVLHPLIPALNPLPFTCHVRPGKSSRASTRQRLWLEGAFLSLLLPELMQQLGSLLRGSLDHGIMMLSKPTILPLLPHLLRLLTDCKTFPLYHIFILVRCLGQRVGCIAARRMLRLDLRRGQRWAALIGVRTDGDVII